MRDYPVAKFASIITPLMKAAASSEMRYKHAAAIVYEKSGLNVLGVNRYNDRGMVTHSTHAEMAAIVNAGVRSDLTQTSVFVVRVNHQNELRCSRPCNRCLVALKDKAVRKVYYSTDDGFIRCECLSEMTFR